MSTISESERSQYRPIATEPAAPHAPDARGGGAAPAAGAGMGHGGGSISLKNLRTFESLKVPAFRWFYASMLCQMAAMNMEMVTRSLLIYRMTGSGTVLGLMALAMSLPMLVFSLWGGVLADRMPKKYLMVFGQGSNAIVALVIALAMTVGAITDSSSAGVWILIVASVFKGAVQGVMMPARQSMIPELVGREQTMNALALNNLGMNLFRLLAPMLAGFAIEFWGFKAVYFIMTGLFVAATLFALPLPSIMSTVKRQRALTELAGGFKYVWQDKTVGLVLLFTLFVVLMSMPYMQMLPVFTEDVLKVGAKGMGILVAVSGVGAILGSLVLASLPNRYRGVMLIVSSLALGGALTLFAFSTSWALSLFAIVFVGLAQAGRMTLSNALLQTYVEDEYRGRVMSIYMMEFGLTSLSVMLAGFLSDSVGVSWAIGGMAIVLTVFAALVWALSPKLRAMH